MKFLCAFIILLTFNVVLSGSFDNEPPKPHKDKYVLHKSCEAAIHKQIDEEMHASLAYATMAAHFGNNKVARKGLEKFFNENSMEEREHAQKFIDYLLSRGARFSGFDVKLMDFIEGEFLDEQVKSISQLQRFITILNGMDTPMGEFLFDQQLQEGKSKM
nr:ferritin heavy chain A [Parasteatoda tepidariorum]